jgi:hypothetical protein
MHLVDLYLCKLVVAKERREICAVSKMPLVFLFVYYFFVGPNCAPVQQIKQKM